MKERPNLDEVIDEIQTMIDENQRSLVRFIHIGTLMDILYLLKEQEAKKPIYNTEKYGDYLPHCSSCEKVLPNRSQYGKVNFCSECGQAVKWND